MAVIWYRDYSEGGVFKKSENNVTIFINACLQEILLWKGEANFNAESGVDYKSIFNSNSFLTSDLETIIEKYKGYFNDITYNITQDENFIAKVTINFYVTGEAISYAIGYNNTGSALSGNSAKITRL